ncbi:pyruvate dehydrogenase (acetyl-transferring) E1 component subunit alpha [Acrocarpospora macrocephala]|uniref:Pyruvate dehydrogenase E1 component subunit alpha n=1 Tax=Acrocarpospora macrocephala TaxID=150177 RepID=A0A5M3WH42_9ACTN|nr:thiamine pyrophosphate-dependent dehydrogenase E1 component subunit alpha [Acrocarpospora macrocephala]GES08447.1 pyruvate dehydrogenase E1 component subunit alpha [Acrocarpospora macrocephala]
MSDIAQLTSSQLSSMYEVMCKSQALELRILKGMRSGEFATIIWPARGQEAVAGALSLALRPDDRLITTYRGLHDHVAKGVPLVEIAGEVLGTSVGACKGKGGTMHIAAPEQGLMMSTGIVGSGLPVGVGLALAARFQKSDRVTAVTFGDGATNTGSFHEAVNLAATWKLPVVFVCQNNLYAEMTPVEETMAIPHVADRAKGVGMPGITVDGNDPVSTYLAIRGAVDRARAGEGPTLVEAVTFRFEGHYAGDQMKYIPAEQLEEAKKHDPMITFRETLLSHPEITEEHLAAIEARAAQEVDEAVEAAKAAPQPDAAEIERDVYAERLVAGNV